MAVKAQNCLTGTEKRDYRNTTQTNMATTSLTLVGNSADSPEPIRRPPPATGHDAEILDVYDPYVGYNDEKFPYQQPQQKMRPTLRAGLLGGICGNLSIYSIVPVE
jgi:hypothetical protein